MDKKYCPEISLCAFSTLRAHIIRENSIKHLRYLVEENDSIMAAFIRSTEKFHRLVEIAHVLAHSRIDGLIAAPGLCLNTLTAKTSLPSSFHIIGTQISQYYLCP